MIENSAATLLCLVITASLTVTACTNTFSDLPVSGNGSLQYGADGGPDEIGVGGSCAFQDSDNDGYISDSCELGTDCDDGDPISYPGAVEICDGRDNDCDGEADEGFSVGTACRYSDPNCTTQGLMACNDEGGEACSPASVPEVCDGRDNNCNGDIDEENPGSDQPCDTGLSGACSSGHTNCVEGEIVCNQDLPQSETESCNGIDDDCDDSVDEGPDGQPLTRPCFGGPQEARGAGECIDGSQVCLQGAYGWCQGQRLPTAETCDQLDNDCNGQVDEGLANCGCSEGSTRPCYTGPPNTTDVGACHGGTQDCLDNGGGFSWGPCVGQILPTEELCTFEGDLAADEDCDGATDEGLAFQGVDVALGESCSLGEGGCRAQGVLACSADRNIYCTAEPSMPLPETCNSIDDNCNGEVDEAPVALGCSGGVGACARFGILICPENSDPEGVSPICNAVEGLPLDEVCNDVDDDCNGTVDNLLVAGSIQVKGQVCSLGQGVCLDDGLWSCAEDESMYCDAQAGNPGQEVCDGLDNDCDGEADDGLGLGNLCRGNGICGDGAWECSPAHEVVCSTLPGGSETPAVPERCNGVDDDCDGEIDEIFAGLGDECQGACGTGVVECNLTETYTQCSTYPGGSDYNPVAEICDGLDNDCDYVPDDGFNLGSMCGDGVCAGGTIVCDGPNASTCSTAGLASAEVCDGLDNDCDGTVDEGFNVGFACDGVGACGLGVYECDGQGAARCSTNPGGSDDDSSPETCDGEDDNCDGQTDEGNPGGGVACDGADADQCNEGVTSCVGGILTCSDATGDSVEVCNSVDDDCDGATDEGFNLGNACDGVGECGAGTLECNGVGGTRCSTDFGGSQSQSVEEKLSQNNCTDGLDNDCDTFIDGGDAPDCPP